MTPRMQAESLAWIVYIGKMRGQEGLFFVFALVKCTRIYFSEANDAPCLLAHSKHRSLTVCSVLQFFSVNLPKARAFTLSTKLVPEAGRVRGLQILTRLAL